MLHSILIMTCTAMCCMELSLSLVPLYLELFKVCGCVMYISKDLSVEGSVHLLFSSMLSNKI